MKDAIYRLDWSHFFFSKGTCICLGRNSYCAMFWWWVSMASVIKKNILKLLFEGFRDRCLAPKGQACPWPSPGPYRMCQQGDLLVCSCTQPGRGPVPATKKVSQDLCSLCSSTRPHYHTAGWSRLWLIVLNHFHFLTLVKIKVVFMQGLKLGNWLFYGLVIKIWW